MSLESLPNDLQEYVKEDNEKFEKEIEEWDFEQKRKSSKSETDPQSPTDLKSMLQYRTTFCYNEVRI